MSEEAVAVVEPVEAKEAVEVSAVAAAEKPIKAPSGPEHKLQSNWNFYFDRKFNQRRADNSAQDYEANLHRLGEFNTVEGFWRLYSWIKPPSEIVSNHNVYMFKGDARPLWESMPNGGCWNIKVQKSNGFVDRLWEELLFACIGGAFNEPRIRGVVLSLRSKGDVISVWTDDSNSRIRIGEKLKDITNLHPSTQVEFKMFADALKDHSSKSHAQAYIFVPQQAEQQPQEAEEQPKEAEASDAAPAEPQQQQQNDTSKDE